MEKEYTVVIAEVLQRKVSVRTESKYDSEYIVE